LTPDPGGVATRISSAIGEAIHGGKPYRIGGLVLTIHTLPANDRIERLQTVDRGPAVAAGSSAAAAVGWATVELERAVRELADLGIVDSLGRTVEQVVPLGASGRRAGASAFGVPLVVLEPITEGRLAATLARHGEGPCAIFIGSPERGPAELLPGGPTSGPHLLVHGGGYHRGR
jgi:hypothetical protein